MSPWTAVLEPSMSSAYPESEETPTAEDEVELWWGAYASRTAFPGFLVCILATAILTAVLYAWGVLLPARWWAFLLTSPLWLAQTGRWLYRTTAFNYRLTTRRLFVSRSFAAAAQAVDLARVQGIHVQCNPIERRLGLGSIRVDSADSAPLVLEGVHDPAAVAALIENGVKRARAHELGPR
jgi:hypothetical protein